MEESELKKILLETCPVKPGQEGRAWAALRDQLYPVKRERSAWHWLFYPTWRGLAVAALMLAVIPFAGPYLLGGLEPVSLATADSQAPGIYATAFYSRPAQAQVVWLNGMEPVSDKPTYLDPTSVIRESKAAPPAGDPNSL
jgi:hypothetical protein